MVMRREVRRGSWLVAVVVLVLATLLPGIQSRVWQAPAAKAAGCYDGAVRFSALVSYRADVYAGPYTTSSRCADINVKFTSINQSVSVTPVRCRDYSAFSTTKTFASNSDGQWKVVASNVLDGTCFYLRLRGSSGTWSNQYGVVAY